MVREAVFFGLAMTAVLAIFFLLQTPGGMRTVTGLLIGAVVGTVLYAGLLFLIGRFKG